MEIKMCPICGEPLNGDEEFCPRCGKEVKGNE